jgi:hypothetical protein
MHFVFDSRKERLLAAYEFRTIVLSPNVADEQLALASYSGGIEFDYWNGG